MEKNTFKIIFVAVAISLFVLSIPFSSQNASDYEILENTLNEGSEAIDDICNSGCVDYPSDWVIPGYELEAENYCLRQCMDKEKMKRDFKDSLNQEFVYRSRNHMVVGKIYCILGLRCLPN